MSRFHLSMLLALAIVWIWAAIDPVYPESWLLENLLTFIFVPLVLLISHYFRLSNLSYALMTLFMIMHVIGAHYTYAQVPLGYLLQDWLGAERNMYDRMTHFCFGLLLAYPMREMFLRIGKTRGVWGYWLPVELVLAFSAVYEIIEWLVLIQIPPSDGLAFLGSQGDIWDAQKDMLLAGIGACVAMMIVVLIHWRYDPEFVKELRASLHLRKNDMPLGEVKLREMVEKEKKAK